MGVSKIVSISPNEEQKASLEAIFKYKFQHPTPPIYENKIEFITPTNIDLIVACSEEPLKKDLENFKLNSRVPVILVSEKAPSFLIKKYNLYKVIQNLNEKSTPAILQDCLTKKITIDSLINEHPEIGRHLNLNMLIQQEIKLTEKGDVENDGEANLERVPSRQISSFEALYQILKRTERKKIIVPYEHVDQSVLHILRTEVVPNLSWFNQEFNQGYYQTAKNKFRPLLRLLNLLEEKSWESRNIMLDLGGSTLAEQGRRSFIGVTPQKKYEQTEFNFVRDVFSRKSVEHQSIAQIRFACAELFKELSKDKSNPSFNVPEILPPLVYDSVSYLIEEGIHGPDLEVVFTKLTEKIATSKTREKNKYKKIRDELIKKYLRDTAYWQKQTKKNILELKFLEKPVAQSMKIEKDKFDFFENTLEELVNMFKDNLKKIPGAYQKYVSFSPEEELLWETFLSELNKEDLNLTNKNIVLSRDASSKNAKIITGRMWSSLDEVIAVIADEKGKSLAKKMDSVFYNLDTGFVATHYLEDFFHIADCFEISNNNERERDVIKRMEKMYNYFETETGIKSKFNEKYLVGCYRNLRRAFLVLDVFQKKNEERAITEKISKSKYNTDRRRYMSMIKHHNKRAVIYLNELTMYLGKIARDTKESIKQQYREECCRQKQIMLSLKDSIKEDIAKNVYFLIKDLDQKIIGEPEHKKRRYLRALRYEVMAKSMSNLCKKLKNVEFDNYESIMSGAA